MVPACVPLDGHAGSREAPPGQAPKLCFLLREPRVCSNILLSCFQRADLKGKVPEPITQDRVVA